MPRFGFSWGMRDDLTLRGGLGLYSGGNPNVWLGNAWSRDGLTQAQVSEEYGHTVSIFDGTLPTIAGPVGGSIPQLLFDEVAAISGDAGTDSDNVLIDPNYEQPQEWKLALGATWDMPWGNGWTADVDWMHTRLEKAAMYVNVSQEQTGTTLAGAPIYTAIPGAGEFNLMLTNTREDGEGDVLSFIVNKDFDFGLDLMIGYAYSDGGGSQPDDFVHGRIQLY